eukprot:443726_1
MIGMEAMMRTIGHDPETARRNRNEYTYQDNERNERIDGQYIPQYGRTRGRYKKYHRYNDRNNAYECYHPNKRNYDGRREDTNDRSNKYRSHARKQKHSFTTYHKRPPTPPPTVMPFDPPTVWLSVMNGDRCGSESEGEQDKGKNDNIRICLFVFHFLSCYDWFDCVFYILFFYF